MANAYHSPGHNRRAIAQGASRGGLLLVGGFFCWALACSPRYCAAAERSALRPDAQKLSAVGIREISGKHLRLFTDLKSSPEVDEIPAVFDLAFAQWCEYFQLSPEQHSGWQMTGCLVHDKARFQAAGLWPSELPPFLNGYCRQFDFWVNEQASSYYQRHLILHEGTHGFMYTLVGGAGPPWYSEGMAELFATHRWQNGKLQLRYLPTSASEVPKLGRVEIVQTEFAAGRAMTLAKILNYDNRAHLKVEPYGWCWAAAAFFDMSPKYHQRFRELAKAADARDFNAQFGKAFADESPTIAEQWQVFVADMDYGYDFQRCQLDLRPGQPLPASGAKFNLAADRGWQNTGRRLEAGTTYELRVSGKYQLAVEPKPWISEPTGVSIRYRHGLPLGIVLGAVRAEQSNGKPSGLIAPITVGRGTSITPQQSGTLFLRVNDFSGELADNAGSAAVEIIGK